MTGIAGTNGRHPVEREAGPPPRYGGPGRGRRFRNRILRGVVLAVALPLLPGCEGTDHDRVGGNAGPPADRLRAVYDRYVGALEERDSATFFSSLARSTRARIDSVLAVREASFEDYARIGARMVGSVPMEARGTFTIGDTAVLVLLSTRRDTVMTMGDSLAILDDYVQRVRFLPTDDGWGVVRVDGAHKPEWMELGAFLASRRDAGPWSHPTGSEHTYELADASEPGSPRRISDLGVALDDENLYLRLGILGTADTARLGGFRIYFDVDADSTTGARGRPGVRGQLVGWERELEMDHWPDHRLGAHSVQVRAHTAVAAVTAHEEPGVPPESDSNVLFRQDRGWIRAEGPHVFIRLPRSVIEASPRGRFAFQVVDWPFAEEAISRRWRSPLR